MTDELYRNIALDPLPIPVYASTSARISAAVFALLRRVRSLNFGWGEGIGAIGRYSAFYLVGPESECCWVSQFFRRCAMARPSSPVQSLYRHILWAAVLGICMSLTAPVGSGQTVNASLSGTVTDATGALVPEVSVTAANTETGVATKTASDPSGHYTLPSLSPGTYNLTFGKEGFSSTVI